MHLFADWATAHGAPAPVVLIVDHGLRSQSVKEAAQVARWAKAAGLEAHVLRWLGRKPKADIEAAARAARYRLMGEWCRARDVGALFLAHTREDQAETFLLRLARGSGVDGLAAMPARGRLPLAGVAAPILYRPLLDASRSELRAYLAARGHAWLDDPMNRDTRFARTRMRALAPLLEAGGLSLARINAAAAHLARAREALETATASLMATCVRFDTAGYAVLDAATLAREPRELGLRVLAGTLMAVSGETYRPRFDRLERLLDAIIADKLAGGRTLHGCRIAPAPKAWRHFGKTSLLVTREPQAAERAADVLLQIGMESVWDGRFRLRLVAPSRPGPLHVAALGNRPDLAEALAHVPAAARGALPALWCKRELVGVPHAWDHWNGAAVEVSFVGGKSH